MSTGEKIQLELSFLRSEVLAEEYYAMPGGI